MHIRPAHSGDSEGLAALISMATERCSERIWEHLTEAGEMPLQAGKRLIAQETGIFSFRHIIVLAEGHAVFAMLSGRHIKQNSKVILDEYLPFVRPLVGLEQQLSNSWYIAGLAVANDLRRRGFATQLLEAAESLAVSLKVPQLSTIVCSGNPEGVGVLERYGFLEQARKKMVRFAGLPHQGDWLLMVKPL